MRNSTLLFCRCCHVQIIYLCPTCLCAVKWLLEPDGATSVCWTTCFGKPRKSTRGHFLLWDQMWPFFSVPFLSFNAPLSVNLTVLFIGCAVARLWTVVSTLHQAQDVATWLWEVWKWGFLPAGHHWCRFQGWLVGHCVFRDIPPPLFLLCPCSYQFHARN